MLAPVTTTPTVPDPVSFGDVRRQLPMQFIPTLVVDIWRLRREGTDGEMEGAVTLLQIIVSMLSMA